MFASRISFLMSKKVFTTGPGEGVLLFPLGISLAPRFEGLNTVRRIKGKGKLIASDRQTLTLDCL